MAIAAYFHPTNMTLAQFSEIHQRLEKAGAEPDPHRLHHSCFGEDGDLMVYDIWDSPESFQAFGQVLMPILAERGYRFTEDHTRVYDPRAGTSRPSVVLNFASRTPPRLLASVAYCRVARPLASIFPARLAML